MGSQRIKEIEVVAEKCCACFVCQLRCSFRLVGAFNLAQAALTIERRYGQVGSEITFTEECDGCTLCAVYCPYGALTVRRREEGRDGA